MYQSLMVITSVECCVPVYYSIFSSIFSVYYSIIVYYSILQYILSILQYTIVYYSIIQYIPLHTIIYPVRLTFHLPASLQSLCQHLSFLPADHVCPQWSQPGWHYKTNRRERKKENEEEEDVKEEEEGVKEVEEDTGFSPTCLHPRKISDHQGWPQQVLIHLV